MDWEVASICISFLLSNLFLTNKKWPFGSSFALYIVWKEWHSKAQLNN